MRAAIPRARGGSMSGDGRGDLPAEFFDLVDEYCSGLVGESGIRRLESYLLGSLAARRHFVEYFHHHTEIQFEVRAGRAAGAVLERLAREDAEAGGRDERPPGRSRWTRPIPRRWLSLAALLATAAAVLVWLGFASGRPSPVRPTPG